MNNKAMGGTLFQSRISYHQELTSTIQRFAEDRGLVFMPYHMGFAAWDISEPDVREGVAKAVQVIGQFQSGKRCIHFVPYVLVFSAGRAKRSRKTPFELNDDMALYALPQKFDPKPITDRLTYAWAMSGTFAVNLSEVELVEISRP